MIQVPNRWVVVEIKPKGKATVYKILAGWLGSYTEGQSWKINSGIKTVVDEGDYYTVIGYSNSVYRCYKKSESMSQYMSSVYDDIKTSLEPRATIRKVSMKTYLKKKHEST